VIDLLDQRARVAIDTPARAGDRGKERHTEIHRAVSAHLVTETGTHVVKRKPIYQRMS
jgi:hypothetical protein